MTLEGRLSAALARRGYEPLSRFLAKAVGFGCGPHHGGADCVLGLTDEQIVERLEHRADANEGRS